MAGSEPLAVPEPCEGRFGRFVRACEETFFLVVLAALMGFGLVQIVGRGQVAGATAWMQPLGQHMVLWIALLGASAATRDRKHIRIDLVSHLLPARGLQILHLMIALFSAGVCGVLCRLSVPFVLEEREFSDPTFPFLHIHETALAVLLAAALVVVALLISEFLKPPIAVFGTVLGVGSVGMLKWLAWAAPLRWLEYQGTVVGFLAVPGWVPACMLPIGFGVLTLRFLEAAWRDGAAIMRPEPQAAEDPGGAEDRQP